MKIIILGSGTLVPTVNRQAPGIVIKIGDEPLLFDSGSGVIYKLPAAGIDYKKINHIFYTHYSHPDHINDLPYIIFTNKYDNPNRDCVLRITGPNGITNFYENIKRLYPIFEEVPFDVNIREVNDESVAYENFSIITKPMFHRDVECAGYRIEAKGKAVVYTGDTDYCKNAVELAKDADVLITECSVPNAFKIDGHLTPNLAGRIATEAGIKKLVLTHLYPVCEDPNIKEEAEEAFSGEIIIARDLMKIDVL